MGTAVDGQGAALNESLVARCVVAGIGAFIGMYSIVALEIGLSIKTLWGMRSRSALRLVWKERYRGGASGARWLTFGQP